MRSSAAVHAFRVRERHPTVGSHDAPKASRRPAMRSLLARAAPFLFALAALVLLATFSPPGTYRPAPPPAITFVRFERVPLDAGDPERRRLGQLTFLGGWRLTSNDPRFGGLSSLHVEGREALAFSDSGWMIRFPLPGGTEEVRGQIRMLADGPGTAR